MKKVKNKKILLFVVILSIFSGILISTVVLIFNGNKTEKKQIVEQKKGPNLGDYVELKLEEGYKQESIKEKNGTGNYLFTVHQDLKWRILRRDNERENLILVSEFPILTDNGEKIGFAGKQGYWNVEEELNKICSIYGHGTGIKEAKSINAEDINTIIGYDKTREKDGTESKYGKQYFGFDNGIFLKEDGTEEIASKENIIEPKLTSYSYSALDYISKEDKAYELLFDNQYYWLATKGVGYCSVWAYYNILSIGNEEIRSNMVFSSDNETREYSCGVRPIVVLNSSTKIDEESGDGTIEKPYQLIVEK